MWIFAAQTTSTPNIIDILFKGMADNPQNVVMAVALLILYFSTRGTRDELSKSREMLNGILASIREERKSEDTHQQIALNMATNAINKIDGVVTSINGMTDAMRQGAEAQRSSSENYFASANIIAESHVATTQMLVNRIADMDKKRAEDEMYSNDRLMVQIDTKLTQHKEDVGRLVGTILAEAQAMHEGTRQVFNANNELILTALRATPPAPEPTPENKSESETS